MMIEFKKFIVPVDGSDSSMRAAEYSVELIRHTGGEILLLHCHRPFSTLRGEPYLQMAINKVIKKSNQLLEPYRELFNKSGMKFEELLLQGSPGDVISETAGIEKCDMIIMGTKGRSSLEGLFLGSVAHRVLYSAPCPVLVIR